MGENRNASGGIRADGCGCGHSDAVYIDTNRILDSCRDKDCFENVRVYLSDIGQEIIDRASSVRAKCAEIVDTCISVSPMNFNRGFYQINVRMYIRMEFETCVGGKAQCVDGLAVVEKSVILFGGEWHVHRTVRAVTALTLYTQATTICRRRSLRLLTPLCCRRGSSSGAAVRSCRRRAAVPAAVPAPAICRNRCCTVWAVRSAARTMWSICCLLPSASSRSSAWSVRHSSSSARRNTVCRIRNVSLPRMTIRVPHSAVWHFPSSSSARRAAVHT